MFEYLTSSTNRLDPHKNDLQYYSRMFIICTEDSSWFYFFQWQSPRNQNKHLSSDYMQVDLWHQTPHTVFRVVLHSGHFLASTDYNSLISNIVSDSTILYGCAPPVIDRVSTKELSVYPFISITKTFLAHNKKKTPVINKVHPVPQRIHDCKSNSKYSFGDLGSLFYRMVPLEQRIFTVPLQPIFWLPSKRVWNRHKHYFYVYEEAVFYSLG